MRILILGSSENLHCCYIKALKEKADELGIEVEVVSERDFYNPSVMPDEIFIDELADMPKAKFDEIFLQIPKEINLELRIPYPVEREIGIPYRDKKVIHPWSRRKKR